MRVARLHVVEGRVEAGVDGEVELLGGVVGERNARRGRLRVVHKEVNAPELGHRLVNNALRNRLVVGGRVDVCLRGQHLDAVSALELLLRGVEFLHVAPGDDEVCALFGERCGDAVADRSGGAVLERRKASARDDGRLSTVEAHGSSLLMGISPAIGVWTDSSHMWLAR